MYILLNSVLLSSAQEIVTGLINNRRISEAWKNRNITKGTAVDTLDLPFFDDFSGKTIFPDEEKWEDNHVFINNTYSVNQISQGFATFDAIDSTGSLYESASSYVFEADRLTSRPIDLDLSPTDNVYLSFFYEPGGVADWPESQDSLTLQFYSPVESKWYSAWKAPSVNEAAFKPVIISITDTRFLRKGFRFRFTNYASLSATGTDPSMAGNCDQWNVDYVLLDKNRNEADTLPADVAFTLPVRTILKTYESMPWKQFRQVFLSEMGPWITIHYMNNDEIVRNVTRNFEIFNVYENTMAHTFTAGATNIDPQTHVDYKANLIYTFNSVNNDSALFRVKSYITTDIFDPKENDTIVYFQNFGNYFAFDDGTAEAGYGINGLGSNHAMVAYRFRSYSEDTLRAVNICFNDSYENSNLRSFDLMVWSSNEGIPGEIIYTQEEMMVSQGESLNGFYTYILSDPQVVNGDFFVGWKQRSETFLNAGFDLNTLHAGRQLYWLNGDWNISQTTGSVMIRPVFGPPIATTSVTSYRQNLDRIRIWPVPAKDYLNIGIEDKYLYGAVSIRIMDLQGRTVYSGPFTTSTDISFLSEGIYFIILESNGKPVAHNRFIKSR